uniref:AlNc14C31G2866 protein n=1 Tax=Albugo laibachii Nc14 TaxID=890382 RepID=F0W7R2_9STRA|nr:AlNc14C31G2866 [Albugo laibachii Nc14]|eukprot:CCA17164.1 AlNc14C31G2866 [Albugo laibachii Nc14]
MSDSRKIHQTLKENHETSTARRSEPTSSRTVESTESIVQGVGPSGANKVPERSSRGSLPASPIREECNKVNDEPSSRTRASNPASPLTEKSTRRMEHGDSSSSPSLKGAHDN